MFWKLVSPLVLNLSGKGVRMSVVVGKHWVLLPIKMKNLLALRVRSKQREGLWEVSVSSPSGMKEKMYIEFVICMFTDIKKSIIYYGNNI